MVARNKSSSERSPLPHHDSTKLFTSLQDSPDRNVSAYQPTVSELIAYMFPQYCVAFARPADAAGATAAGASPAGGVGAAGVRS